jgi:hypothetical protein
VCSFIHSRLPSISTFKTQDFGRFNSNVKADNWISSFTHYFNPTSHQQLPLEVFSLQSHSCQGVTKRETPVNEISLQFSESFLY